MKFIFLIAFKALLLQSSGYYASDVSCADSLKVKADCIGRIKDVYPIDDSFLRCVDSINFKEAILIRITNLDSVNMFLYTDSSACYLPIEMFQYFNVDKGGIKSNVSSVIKESNLKHQFCLKPGETHSFYSFVKFFKDGAFFVEMQIQVMTRRFGMEEVHYISFISNRGLIKSD